VVKIETFINKKCVRLKKTFKDIQKSIKKSQVKNKDNTIT